MIRPSRGAFAATTAATFAGVGFLLKPARGEQFRWRFGHDYPVDSPLHVRLVQTMEKIKKDTNGQVEIHVYPDSTLGSDPAMLEQLRVGALDMLAYSGGILDGLVPLSSIESVAFVFPTVQVAHAAMDGDLGALIRQAILDKGLVAMERVWDDGFREFTSSKAPIRTVDDLQGMKLRVAPSKLRLDTFRTLGASPTPIAANELYTALQSHLVDGQETPLTAIKQFRVFEVQKYCSLTHHMWTDHWILAHLEKWNSLPRNFQTIVRNRINEAARSSAATSRS